MSIKVLLFGQIMDLTQCPSLTLEDLPDTDSLKDILLERYPALSTLPFVVSLGKKAISTNTPLSPASVVALLPPFSGG